METFAYVSDLELPEVETIELIGVKNETHNTPKMGTGACTIAGCACTAFTCDYPGQAGDLTLCTVDGCGHFYRDHSDSM